MTAEELQEKEIEVLNKYLGDEARKLSTGQVMRSTKEVLKDAYEEWEDLYDFGKKIQEQIKPYRYMLEEGNVYKYLETVGRTMFGKSNSNISRSEAIN
jgi:hypothetical protein